MLSLDSRKSNFFEELPLEMFECITSYLPARAFCILGLVSKVLLGLTEGLLSSSFSPKNISLLRKHCKQLPSPGSMCRPVVDNFFGFRHACEGKKGENDYHIFYPKARMNNKLYGVALTPWRGGRQPNNIISFDLCSQIIEKQVYPKVIPNSSFYTNQRENISVFCSYATSDLGIVRGGRSLSKPLETSPTPDCLLDSIVANSSHIFWSAQRQIGAQNIADGKRTTSQIRGVASSLCLYESFLYVSCVQGGRESKKTIDIYSTDLTYDLTLQSTLSYFSDAHSLLGLTCVKNKLFALEESISSSYKQFYSAIRVFDQDRPDIQHKIPTSNDVFSLTVSETQVSFMQQDGFLNVFSHSDYTQPVIKKYVCALGLTRSSSKIKHVIDGNALLLSTDADIKIFDLRKEGVVDTIFPSKNRSFNYVSDLIDGKVIASDNERLYSFSSRAVVTTWKPFAQSSGY